MASKPKLDEFELSSMELPSSESFTDDDLGSVIAQKEIQNINLQRELEIRNQTIKDLVDKFSK